MDKIVDPAFVAKAYQNPLSGKGVSGKDEGKSGEGSFGDIVANMAQKSVDSMREGERIAAEAVKGKANEIDVIQAVNNAEMTLQTVVALRDRMISAYQDIMRMPI